MGFRNISWPIEVGSTSLRRQDLLCLFMYYMGFSRIRNCAFRFFRKPVVRILAFHDIPDDLVANFRAQIEDLKERANVISLSDFFSGKLSWKKINVVITFDDGFRGWVDNALPVLREFGLNATFFICSGFVGLEGEEESDFLRNNMKSSSQTTGSLDAEGLRKLVEEGFAVGGHTVHHVNLLEIGDMNILRGEIQIDKEKLEKIAGMKVEYFAYPFGVHQSVQIDIVRALQEAGYRGAVTTIPGFNTGSTNRFLLHRDLVNASMPLAVFRARLLGNHDSARFARRILQI